MSEYMALYRKWRPKEFADVVGQDHITKVLCGEIISHSVSHAYLFCGSRGTGKTTCAKILSKAVNCENPVNGDPCGKCAKCLAFEGSYDIVEMDAASNNGVDEIRSLCERVNFMPIELKRRVYIIDEVHMLTESAFNALLKTLEEPPSHVMFILATTELHKIPPTIRSRCKRFDFHRISPEAMMPRLKYIAEQEKIGIKPDALRLIAFLATGAMRDALSMLELFVGRTDIDREKAASALGVVGNAPVLKLLESIAQRDSAAALKHIDEIYTASKDMGVLCSELAEMFRNLLVVKYASDNVGSILNADPDVIISLRNCEDMFTKERLLYSLEITEDTQNKLAKSGFSARTLVEIMVVKLCDSRLSTLPESLLERIASLEAKIESGVPVKKVSAEIKKTASSEELKNFDESVKVNDAGDDKESTKDEISLTEQNDLPDKTEENKKDEHSGGREMIAFGELLDEIRQRGETSVYSMLLNSYAEIHENDALKIFVNSMVYDRYCNDTKIKEMITAVASKLLGMPVKVEFVQSSNINKNTKPDLPV